MNKILKIISPLVLLSSAIILPITLTSCTAQKEWTSADFVVNGFNIIDDPNAYWPTTGTITNGLKNIDLENGVISFFADSHGAPNASGTEMKLVLTADPIEMMNTYYQYYCKERNFPPWYVDSEKTILNEHITNYFQINCYDFQTKNTYFNSKPFCEFYNSWDNNKIKISFRPSLQSDGNTSFASVGDWVKYKFSFMDPTTKKAIYTKEIKIVAVAK